MTPDKRPKGAKNKKTDRRAEALRGNLLKRKQQDRARAMEDAPAKDKS